MLVSRTELGSRLEHLQCRPYLVVVTLFLKDSIFMASLNKSFTYRLLILQCNTCLIEPQPLNHCLFKLLSPVDLFMMSSETENINFSYPTINIV